MSRRHIHDFETVYTALTLADGDTLLIDEHGWLESLDHAPAITLTGGAATIRNGGEISTYNPNSIAGTLAALFDIRIFNAGVMTSSETTIVLSSEENVGGEVRIHNSGSIGNSWDVGGGIDLSSLHADKTLVVSSGHIDSFNNQPSYIGSSGADVLFNSGTITDDVVLGAGDDWFRNIGTLLIGHIYGGDGDDRIVAGDGNDSIWGGGGRDVIAGGVGGDRYYLDALTDSAPDRAHADVIRGFDKPSGDIVLLYNIDADATAEGNQPFSFVGTAAFTGTPGELRCDLIRGGAVLYSDVDGDAQSDFALVVRGHISTPDDLQIAF